LFSKPNAYEQLYRVRQSILVNVRRTTFCVLRQLQSWDAALVL
jgi:hypothetical protein